MFGGVTIAKRVEAAEARLTRAVAGHVAARDARTLARDIGDGIAVCTAEDSPFEKVIGAGFGEGDLAAVIDFEAEAGQRGRRVRVEVSTLADPSFARALTERGYRLEGFENVLGLELGGAPTDAPATGATEVRLVRDGEAETWIDTVVTAFFQPDRGDDAGAGAMETFPREPLVTVFRDFMQDARCSFFLALREGVVAGGSSLRIDSGIAQLTGAATLAPHRRRGVQSAMLRARLRAARERGCDLAVVTTQPGSKSQENATRAGFTLLYPRAILTK